MSITTIKKDYMSLGVVRYFQSDRCINHANLRKFNQGKIPSVYKGTHAPSAIFWRLAALTSIGVRPVRLIPLPCQPPKYGTWGPKEFCASDL